MLKIAAIECAQRAFVYVCGRERVWMFWLNVEILVLWSNTGMFEFCSFCCRYIVYKMFELIFHVHRAVLPRVLSITVEV